MAAGSPFTFTPNKVQVDTPEFPVVVTESESFKKKTALIDDSENMRWRLLFKTANVTVRNAILLHFREQHGGLTSFTWSTVPSYIEGGVNQTVRYAEEKGYIEQPLDHFAWMLHITLELVV